MGEIFLFCISDMCFEHIICAWKFWSLFLTLFRWEHGMDRESLREGYLGGRSLSELVKESGLSYGTVRSRLLGMGVKLRGVGCPSNRKRIELPVLEILSRRNRGEKVRDLARSYGVCEDTLRARLRGE